MGSPYRPQAAKYGGGGDSSLWSHVGVSAAESAGGEVGKPTARVEVVCGRGTVRGKSENAVEGMAGGVVFVRLRLSSEGAEGCVEVRGDVGNGCGSRCVPEGEVGSTVSWVCPERLGTGSTGGDERFDAVAVKVASVCWCE